MATIPVRDRWDLDSIFPGGIDSAELARQIDDVEAGLLECETTLASMAAPTCVAFIEPFCALVARLHSIGLHMAEAGAFVEMISCLDTRAEEPRLLSGRLNQLDARHNVLLTQLDRLLPEVPEQIWPVLLEHPAVAPVRFGLEQRRRRAADALPPEQEAVIATLAVDGFKGWTDIYQIVNGSTMIPWEGSQLPLSTAQQMINNSPDRSVRAGLFAKMVEAREPQAPTFAAALNHAAGFRTAGYSLRGWSVLHEALTNDLIRSASLEAMWTAIAANMAPIAAFLDRKARMLGLERLASYDLMAPVGTPVTYSWPQTAEAIADAFASFSPELGAFARQNFTEGWIDCSEGPGRAPGFSASFPLPVKNTTRIFMNHKEMPMIVAHEMGHSYSFQYLNDSPAFSGMLPGSHCLMEVPSTFCQLLTGKHLAKRAATVEERLYWLSDLSRNAYTDLINRRGAFLFERSLYEARLEGPLSAGKISELYLSAQETANHGAVTDFNPYGWVSLHFMGGGAPFYNFPYTVALLLSACLYARWQQEGPAFAARYPAFLADLGHSTVDDLAARHLGGDLTDPAFWQLGIDVVLDDVREFLRLTDEA
jgi:oligoendopeptidase F